MSDKNTLPDLIFVTGMSGAGRSTALKVFEDLGYTIIDNLPQCLLVGLIDGLKNQRISLPLVLGMDVRAIGAEVESFLEIVDDLRGFYEVRLLYLGCQNDILMKRYNVSRHRHPYGVKSLAEGIQEERERLSPIKSAADHVIDTSVLSVVTLGRVLKNIFGRPTSPQLQIRIMSFSYRRGIPPEADMVLDARFLDNPHYEEHLQPLTGRDDPVAKFLTHDKSWSGVFSSIKNMLLPTLTGFKNSGRSYLTIACGCTGGQHRSVFMAEQIALYLKDLGETVFIEHREIDA
ncbi:MAG: RNase adapter RapZ [Candidatus Paracaedibacteraceae bacterium]|nr:RNase adapter RapZ [Candidatus Paracaedibacteraceae bacterium]